MTEIKLYSKSGNFIDLLNDVTNRGKILDVSIDWERLGGLKEAKIKIKNLDIELGTGNEIQFYYNSNHIFTGYISQEPLYNKKTLEVLVEGYWSKLTPKNNYSFTSKTILEILTSLFSTAPFDRYNNDFSLVNPPALTIPIFELERASLAEAVKSLVEIANNDWRNTQYTAYFDKENRLVFTELTRKAILFEGYDYQSPKIDKERPTVNAVYMFTRNPDKSSTVYRGYVKDLDSISAYGELDKTITFPFENGSADDLDDTDNNAVVQISKQIVNHGKGPNTKITIDDIQEVYEAGKIKTISARGYRRYTVMEGDSLADWDLSSVVSSTVTIDTSQYLFGNASIKWDLASGSVNDLGVYNFPSPIAGIFVFSIYVYCENGGRVKIRLSNPVDQKSEDIIVQDQWVRLDIAVRVTGGVESGLVEYDDDTDYGSLDYEYSTDSGSLDYDSDTDSGGLDYESDDVGGGTPGLVEYDDETDTGILRYSATPGGNNLYYADKFEVIPLSDTGEFYLDKALVSVYNAMTYELSLEKQKIEIKNNSLLNKIELGEKAISLVDNIKSSVSQGDTAYEFLKRGT